MSTRLDDPMKEIPNQAEIRAAGQTLNESVTQVKDADTLTPAPQLTPSEAATKPVIGQALEPTYEDLAASITKSAGNIDASHEAVDNISEHEQLRNVDVSLDKESDHDLDK